MLEAVKLTQKDGLGTFSNWEPSKTVKLFHLSGGGELFGEHQKIKLLL